MRMHLHESALHTAHPVQNPSLRLWKRNAAVLLCTVALAVLAPVTILNDKPKAKQLSKLTVHRAAETRRQRVLSSSMAQTIPTPEIPTPPPLAKADRSIGVYMTANSIARSNGFLERTMESIAMLPHPTIVIDVKENYVLYTSVAPLAQDLGTIYGQYDLAEIVRRARKKGIRTIARFVAAKDRGLAIRRSDVHIRHPETGYSVGSVWVDPAHEFVLEYNRELLEEIVSAGVDEVNIDYIRYPTEYAWSRIGLTGEQRADHVEAFIKMARSVIDEINPQTKLGISTYAIIGLDYDINVKILGQDVARFAPLVDIISPMAYPASFSKGYLYRSVPEKSRMYSLVFRTLEGYAKFLGAEHRSKIRPWIQGYRVREVDMRDQIQAVYDAGSCGFMVWNASNLYTAMYQAMEGMSIPEACGEYQP